jgi:DNA-binding response OmpR family regulator
MKKNTLIIDKRVELSTKYKKLIEGAENFVHISRDLTSAIGHIQENEPDLIIISDSIDEPLAEFCRKLRVLTFNMRPVIVAMSKSGELADKLEVLENGADDFLSEPINSDEFKMRIKAHLRREYEVNVNPKTMLPNKVYSLKALKRVIAKKAPWACLLVSVENFDNYKEIYTELASDKLTQTFCAIINSALDEDDFLGHMSRNEFLIITNPMRAEKIASFLTFAFDTVSSKFYSLEDAKRGYAILQGDELAGRRSEFVFTTIGVVTNEFKKYTNPKQVVNSLVQTRRLARRPSGSSYAIERPKLSAGDSVLKKSFNNKLWVLEEDEALSFLLSTTLELAGYSVETLENTQAIGSLMSLPVSFSDPPAVVVIDAGNLESTLGLDICKALKADQRFVNSKFIVTSIFHDKEMVLNSGADLYLPKPYELATLMKWVKIFIKEINA